MNSLRDDRSQHSIRRPRFSVSEHFGGETVLRHGLMHSEAIRVRQLHVGFRTAVCTGEKRETADEGQYFDTEPKIILRVGSDVARARKERWCTKNWKPEVETDSYFKLACALLPKTSVTWHSNGH